MTKTQKLAFYTSMDETTKIQFCTANGLSIDNINADTLEELDVSAFQNTTVASWAQETSFINEVETAYKSSTITIPTRPDGETVAAQLGFTGDSQTLSFTLAGIGKPVFGEAEGKKSSSRGIFYRTGGIPVFVKIGEVIKTLTIPHGNANALLGKVKGESIEITSSFRPMLDVDQKPITKKDSNGNETARYYVSYLAGDNMLSKEQLLNVCQKLGV